MHRTLHRLLLPLLALCCLARGGVAQKNTTPIASPAVRFTNAAITLKVTRFDEAQTNVLDAARSEGADVLDAHTSVTENGRRHGWIQIRLPAGRLPSLLTRIRQTGTLYAEKVSTRDNASEFDSLEQRAVRLKEHQGRLSGILDSERRLRGSDILFVQERLFRASVDESLLRQRRTDIARRAEVSTLLVQMFEPLPVSKMARARVDLAAHFALARGNAVGTLVRLASRATTALAYALVWSPFWLPVAVVLIFVLRRLWQARTGLVSLIGMARHQVENAWHTLKAARYSVSTPPLPPATTSGAGSAAAPPPA